MIYILLLKAIESCFVALTLTLTLTLILFLQPETTATFGSIHRLCHTNYDLSTSTRIRSFELAIKSPVIIKFCRG